MAKYYGNIGFAIYEEVEPGIYDDIIKDVKYGGNFVRDYGHVNFSQEGSNDDIKLNSEISILADDFMIKHAGVIRYVEWKGIKWRVTGINFIHYPRLNITFGGRYV